MRLRFPKAARLSQTREFHRVRDQGRSWAGRYFVLGLLAQPNGTEAGTNAASRVGFVTSRRVGGAVVRNRVRRRLREIVRANRAQLRPGCWIVLIARRAAAAANFRQLNDEWLRLTRRAGILLPPPAPAPADDGNAA